MAPMSVMKRVIRFLSGDMKQTKKKPQCLKLDMFPL